MMILAYKKGAWYFPFILFFIIVLFFPNCNKDTIKFLNETVIYGDTMGTTYSIKLALKKSLDPEKEEELKKGILEILNKIDGQMSNFKNDSEISRFNKYKGTEWFEISSDTAQVIDQAIKISILSNGAFDITISPLIDLWGFGQKEGKQKVISEEIINSVLPTIGYQELSVNLDPPQLKKQIIALNCNLSAIAKGYGVDKIAEYLLNEDLTNFLVEVGGEIRTSGINKRKKTWRVGVSLPDAINQIYKGFELKNQAIATSGDYRNYFEIDNKRYSHTIDPHTGKPITHKLASVSVVHDSCMMADGLATAINVLGPEKGWEFAKKNKLAVLLIIRGKDGFFEKTTTWFDDIMANK